MRTRARGQLDELVARGQRHPQAAVAQVRRHAVRRAEQRVAAEDAKLAARVEDQQPVARGVDHVGETALAGDDVRRAGARRRAADPLERVAVVDLEHPLADGDHCDRPAAVDRRHAAGLGGDADPSHVIAVDHRHGASALVGGEDASTGRRRVMREHADGHRVDRPAGQASTRERASPGSVGTSTGPPRSGEAEMAWRARERDAGPDPAAARVDQRKLRRVAQADRDEAGQRVGHDTLGPVADPHDAARGPRLERGEMSGSAAGGSSLTAVAEPQPVNAAATTAPMQPRVEVGVRCRAAWQATVTIR